MIVDAPAVHRKVDEAFARGDFASAIAQLRALLSDAPDQVDGWMKLAAIQRAGGQLPDALESIDRALAIQPLFYLALLFKGTLLQALGASAKAAEFFAAALFHSEGQNPSPTVARQLAMARQAIDRQADLVSSRARAALATAPIEQDRADRLTARFADNVVRRRPVFHQEPTHYRFPGLADIEFFDDVRAAWLDELQDHADAIRAEYEALVAIDAAAAQPYIDLQPDYPAGPWTALNRSRDWNAIHLIRYGEVVAENARHCPLTMRLFGQGQQPAVAGLAPNLMFSVLAPHTHIPPHHGVANFRSVLHLPLIVPPGCAFRVGADTRPWQVGIPWIFDDTIEHEAWNDSDDPRVILIADVWRPELDQLERQVVQSFMQALDADPHLGAL